MLRKLLSILAVLALGLILGCGPKVKEDQVPVEGETQPADPNKSMDEPSNETFQKQNNEAGEVQDKASANEQF